MKHLLSITICFLIFLLACEDDPKKNSDNRSFIKNKPIINKIKENSINNIEEIKTTKNIFNNNGKTPGDLYFNGLKSAIDKFNTEYIHKITKNFNSNDEHEIAKGLIYFLWIKPTNSTVVYDLLDNQNICSDFSKSYVFHISPLKNAVNSEMYKKMLQSYEVNYQIADMFNKRCQSFILADFTTNINNIKDRLIYEELFLERLYSISSNKQFYLLLSSIGYSKEEITKWYEHFTELCRNNKNNFTPIWTLTKNEYYIELPKYWKFLNDDIYSDDEIDTLIDSLNINLVSNLKAPSELKYDKYLESYYRKIYEFLNDKILFFKSDKRIQWVQNISTFIEKTIHDFNEIIKQGRVLMDGLVSYHDLYISNAPMNTIRMMFKLWFKIAPVKASEFILTCLKDEKIRNYYISYIINSSVYEEYFIEPCCCYLLHENLNIRTFLKILQLLSKYDIEDKRYVERELQKFTNIVLNIYAYSFENMKKMEFQLNKQIHENSIKEWIEFFNMND